MASYSFAQLCALKAGDEFYECESGMNLHARVVSLPLVGHSTSLNKAQVRFSAVNMKSGRVLDYLATEGLLHYGPRIYTEPEYVHVKDGKAEYVFVD